MSDARSRKLAALAAVAALAGIVGGAAARAGVEDDLDRRWQGAWVVVEVPVQSDCRSAGYADNDVHADLVHGKGAFEFAAGELARVHQVRLRRKRVEVQVDLQVPVLAARPDGPFTLYDRLFCKVELQFRVERPEREDLAFVDARIGELLERHTTSEAAYDSPGWNGREVEPFPLDYEETLAAYEIWKVERHNAQVEARRREALELAAELIAGVEAGADYAEGFAAGVHANRRLRFDGCGAALSSAPAREAKRGPGSEEYSRGHRDGSTLVYFIRLAETLQDCSLESPAS